MLGRLNSVHAQPCWCLHGSVRPCLHARQQAWGWPQGLWKLAVPLCACGFVGFTFGCLYCRGPVPCRGPPCCLRCVCCAHQVYSAAMEVANMYEHHRAVLPVEEVNRLLDFVAVPK